MRHELPSTAGLYRLTLCYTRVRPLADLHHYARYEPTTRLWFDSETGHRIGLADIITPPGELAEMYLTAWELIPTQQRP